MKRIKNKTSLYSTVIGSLLIAAILILGTYWSGQKAQQDTEKAVSSVSKLYLDELAGRREQVVSSALKRNIGNMQTAVSLLTNEDLSDTAHLQAYQQRMKQLYTLEKFAFVDTDGLIYTANGTMNDIDKYSFDYNNIDTPEISVRDDGGGSKSVIIAVPVERLPLDGKTLTVCFMEIDMNTMLEGVSLQSDNNNTTFCNIYTKNGTALTDMVLGGLASEDNLLKAMEHADFDGDVTAGDLRSDFEKGKAGVVSFTYNEIKETLSYTPIDGTDWMLTYLIRESVISENISSVSQGIITRSLVQSFLTALVLLAMFLFIFLQSKKNAKLAIEKETSMVKQGELEQRLQLQNELLEQEKLRTRQDHMITALASDYRSVYHVDLDRNDAVCYRADPDDHEQTDEGIHFPFYERFKWYAENSVDEKFREGFLKFIEPDQIRDALSESPIIAYRYLVHRNGYDYYEMIRMAGVRHAADRDDHIVHAIGLGLTNVDAEVRESMAKNQALVEALAAAEEANKAKTAFLSNMSHEIRTPMNAIIGLDSLALRNESLDAETREYLEKIGGSARHLLGLINDILDMSRIESGKMILRREEFSFRSMLEQINTMVMTQCGDKGLKYECKVIGGVSDYYIGDDMKLKQILINILSNAIKFTEVPGEISLTVERAAVFEDQTTIRFVIKDTGIGMDKDFLPKVYDAFTQEDSGRNNKYGSTGLGMAITKNIVELMNGTISVDSEKGVGTTFTVAVTLKNSEHIGDEDFFIDTKDMRVLVVDDEEIDAEHARIVLDEAGIMADTCQSGKEALHMLEINHIKQQPYNLVLLDWKMPEMDGIEVAKEIRKLYSSETTIIILTSFNWDEIMDDALHIGVDSFLAKPLFASNVVGEFERIARKNNMTLFHEKQRAELAGKRILLAEDMFINAEIMKKLLEIKDAKIYHAENGRIAVDMFSQSEPGYYDAVLMDVRMPEMDGLEAAKTIRALDRDDAKTVPIIAMTANAFDEDVQRSLQVGMNAHLSKPVEPERLYQTLGELIWEADQRK